MCVRKPAGLPARSRSSPRMPPSSAAVQIRITTRTIWADRGDVKQIVEADVHACVMPFEYRGLVTPERATMTRHDHHNTLFAQ